MRPLKEIEDDAEWLRFPLGSPDSYRFMKYSDAIARLAADAPDLLAALEQARSIAVRLEQEVAANEPTF